MLLLLSSGLVPLLGFIPSLLIGYAGALCGWLTGISLHYSESCKDQRIIRTLFEDIEQLRNTIADSSLKNDLKKNSLQILDEILKEKPYKSKLRTLFFDFRNNFLWQNHTNIALQKTVVEFLFKKQQEQAPEEVPTALTFAALNAATLPGETAANESEPLLKA